MPLSYDWEVTVAICAALCTFFVGIHAYGVWLGYSATRILKKIEHRVDQDDPNRAEQIAIPIARGRAMDRKFFWQLAAFAAAATILWTVFVWSRLSH